MSIESYFFNAVNVDGKYDRTYTAQNIADYFNLLIGNGVFPNPSTQLQVMQSKNMQIVIKTGSGWINGHKLVNTSDLLLNIEPSDVILNRIDSIVFCVDFPNRLMDIRVKKGISATTPIAPALIRNENIYELQLATVKVNKQITSISQSMINDTRASSELCGIVQGLIKQADTETLFTQWQTGYNEAITKDQNDFDDWFNDVKKNLSTSTLIRQFSGHYETTKVNQKIIPINVASYNLNLDILSVFVNGMRLQQDIEYTKDSNNQITLTKPITKIGTPIMFEVLKCVDGENAQSVVEEVEELQKKNVNGVTYENNQLQLMATGSPIGNPVEIIASGGLGGDTVPIGTFMSFTGSIVQDGWLPCDGRAVSRTDYAALFAVIGTSYGVGNGTTTFNIPNEPNPISYRTTSTGGTRLITHDPVLKVIIKAKQVVPVVASIEDNLTSVSKTNGLSAAQGKILNTKIVDLNGSMINIDEKNMALFAYDGTKKYYAGGYNRRYGYVDRIGDRIFVDFNLQISVYGDLSKAPDDAVIYLQVNNLPDYVTNRVAPIAGYNLALPALYSQINAGLTKIDNITHIQITKSGNSAYSVLTKADIKTNAAIIGGIDFRRALS